MRNQLEMQDVGGNNLAMLASRCGNVAILKAVMAEIQHTGVRGGLCWGVLVALGSRREGGHPCRCCWGRWSRV